MHTFIKVLVFGCLVFPAAIFGMWPKRKQGDITHANRRYLSWNSDSSFAICHTDNPKDLEYTFHPLLKSIKQVACPCGSESRSFDAERSVVPLFSKERVMIGFERNFIHRTHCKQCDTSPIFAPTYDWRGPALLLAAAAGLYYRKEIVQTARELTAKLWKTNNV